MPVTVYPVPGVMLPGHPTVPRTVSRSEADELVASGAYQRKPSLDAEEPEPEAEPAAETEE